MENVKKQWNERYIPNTINYDQCAMKWKLFGMKNRLWNEREGKEKKERCIYKKFANWKLFLQNKNQIILFIWYVFE